MTTEFDPENVPIQRKAWVWLYRRTPVREELRSKTRSHHLIPSKRDRTPHSPEKAIALLPLHQKAIASPHPPKNRIPLFPHSSPLKALSRMEGSMASSSLSAPSLKGFIASTFWKMGIAFFCWFIVGMGISICRNCSGRVRSRRPPIPLVKCFSWVQNQGVATKAAKYSGIACPRTQLKVRYSGDTYLPANSDEQTEI